MYIAKEKQIKRLLHVGINLLVLSYFICSQLFLPETFLFPDGLKSGLVKVAQADVSDPWYDADYSYRKEIDITGGTVDLTDYQVKLNINYAAGKMNPDFSDLRFVGVDGLTSYDYYIESKTNSVSAVVWVKIDSIPASGTSIYMYYGNTDAVSTSDSDSTFVFFDGFEGGQVDTDKWAVSGTVTQANSEVTIGSGSNIYSNQTFGFDTEFVLRTHFSGGCFFRIDNSNYGNYIRIDSFWDNSGSEVVMVKDGNLGSSYAGATDGVNYHEWRIQRVGTTAVKFYRDNSLFKTYSDIATISTANLHIKLLDPGQVIDYIYVRKINTVEPGATFSAEEDRMDHLVLTGVDQTVGEAQSITITAVGSSGNDYLYYTGDKTITLSGANDIRDYVPTFTDKEGHTIAFGSGGTINFTDGVAHTDITLYKAEAAEVDVTDGTYSSAGSAAYDLDVTASPSSVYSFDILSSSGIISESPFSLALTAKDTYGNTTDDITGPTLLTLDSGIIDTASVADVEFINGVYIGYPTISEIYQDKNIVLSVIHGSISDTRNLSVVGVSHGGGYIPAKPNLSDMQIIMKDGKLSWSQLQSDIIQIAISTWADFRDASWEKIPSDINLAEYVGGKIYLKFRTNQDAVSDVITYNFDTVNDSDANLSDGDIVKTAESCDVYIVKIKNGKLFKRLILNPGVFNSYRHLEWANIKSISQEQSDRYISSNLVQVAGDDILYELYPNGDTGERRIFDLTKSYDADSIYEINDTDRDSYKMKNN